MTKPRLHANAAAIFTALFIEFCPCPVRAQTAPGQNAPHQRSEQEGMVPATDRDAEAWLRRAQEAADQADWKLAADTLARVIDQFGDRTVSPDDGQHYFSAARCAQKQLESWPPEGLAVYRQLFDAEAARRFETAKQKNDLDGLRQVAHRFSHTTHGPKALDVLAGRLIDRHELGEAIDVLNRLLELPNSAIPLSQTLQKLCIAFAAAGDFHAAQATLDRLRKQAQTNRNSNTQTSELVQRVDELERFIDGARRAGGTSTQPANQLVHLSTRWPGMVGAGAALGPMPSVNPAVTADTAQFEPLPGTQRLNLQTTQRILRRTGRPPVWQVAANERSLFYTSPDGLVARDLASFELLWKSIAKRPPRDPRIERQRVITGLIDVDNSDRLDELTATALYHEYRGLVSTTAGMVFMIEQFGTVSEQFPAKDGTPPPNNIFTGDEFGEPNSLRAFDAETGKPLWTKGRGGPVDDGLRYAHFLSTPIGINQGMLANEASTTRGNHTPEIPLARSPLTLVALAQVGPDLQLITLGPAGQVIRATTLGTGPPGMFPMNGVLIPALHEGSLFVPTGAGMFICLAAHDLSLQWQTPYDRAPLAISHRAAPRQWGPGGPATGGLAQPDEWLACPPIVVGGTVVLAPSDGEYLLAFDRHTGSIKWIYPRGEHRYLVGTDGQRVFIAGRSFVALDAQTGRAAWGYDRSLLTGRPAICGDLVLLPTEQGLVRIVTSTGEVSGDVSVTERPLGNLYSVDGALYCLSAEGISKYPDLEQSRTIAQSALKKDPTDKQSLLRLAQLESLSGNWKNALAVLEQADADPPESQRDQNSTKPATASTMLLDRIRHQRVETLLKLAGRSTGADRRALLGEAARLALRPTDQVAAGLALSEHLKESGESQAALQTLQTLQQTHANEPIQLEPLLKTTAGVAVAERLAFLSAPDAGAARRVSPISKPSFTDEAAADGLPPVLSDGGFDLELVFEEGVAPGFAPDARSFWDPAHPFDSYSNVIPVKLMRQIKGVLTSNSSPTPYQWSSLVGSGAESDGAEMRGIELIAHAAAVIGDFAVLDAGSHVCAISLSTGRMQWPPLALDRAEDPLPEPALTAVGEIIVIAIDPSTLLAVPAKPGATPIWRRRWASDRLRQLIPVGDVLATVSHESHEVCVINPASGRILRQFKLDLKSPAEDPAVKADKEEANPLIAFVGATVCYPMAKGLQGRDVRSGQILWDHPEPAAIIDIRPLDDLHVAVCLPNLIADVMRVDSGETVRQITLDGMVMPPLELSLDRMAGERSPRLTAFCKTNGDPAQLVLQSFSMSGGPASWRRELGPIAFVNRHMMRSSPGYVAVVEYTQKAPANPHASGNPQIEKTRLHFVDKRTGRELIDPPVELVSRRVSREDGMNRLIKDVIVAKDRVVAVGPEAYYVLKRRVGPRPPSEDTDEASTP